MDTEAQLINIYWGSRVDIENKSANIKRPTYRSRHCKSLGAVS
eukprot:CAMPEP_0204298042 /NCGR_PEP_ID=MMETSP0468-20130131/74338_1 /ASSEMBLY_ACC=CAM_ASM_000383 /TAXON_ID=2969 /ORGANISM="Oxyrrhis marina" /LENGTH=42 /DNA_ID= /DNA_START= /DNA_END= /DNA_ORIENTATION=